LEKALHAGLTVVLCSHVALNNGKFTRNYVMEAVEIMETFSDEDVLHGYKPFKCYRRKEHAEYYANLLRIKSKGSVGARVIRDGNNYWVCIKKKEYK